MKFRLLVLACASALVPALLGTSHAASESLPVSIELEEVDALRRVWVRVELEGGSERRILLRETPSEVAAVASGADPRGRAAFATWSESPGGRWFSYSRDGGEAWSEPRPLSTTLRLRDQAVGPAQAIPAVPARFVLPRGGRLFLVQFATIALPEWRAALRESGVQVLQFFPHNAYIVNMPPGIRDAVAGLDFVERVEPYHPWFRIERSLRSWLDESSGSEQEARRVRVVSLEWGAAAKQRILAAAQSLGASAGDWWPSGHILELWVTREQLRRVAELDDVSWIDPWTPKETDMDLVRQDAGVDWLETETGFCGQGVNGEVMDNGIQDNHQDFDGVLLHTNSDVQSHGTNTYGIVFGNGDRDGDGNAQGTGHMPCAGQGIFADYGAVSDRFAHTQELKESPYFAAFQTNSWGDARTTSYTSISSEMDDIIWRLDIAITQSQSNAGTQASRPQAWAKNIVSVGGVRHYNTLDTSDDAWASGASIGPAEDGRLKPDLNYWYDSIYTTTTGGGYTTGFGGTSAATPEVAGVLGLMAQMWSENVWNTNPAGNSVFEKLPHFSTLKALMINNATQYPFSGTSDDLTRVHQGWGRPNAQLARERAARSFIVDEDQALTLGQTATYELVVEPGEAELKVTMVYPDPPGTTSATLHRINDVSLRVVSPTGTTYHGNVGLDAGNYSTPGGSPNDVDTVENVFVENPEPGSWTVEINAAEVNQDAHLDTPIDDVTFALVATGAVLSGSCGDGAVDPGEECDGTDLGGATCLSVGCSNGGTLTCNTDCTLDRSACAGCPVCGDLLCEFGETCASCPADCVSASAAVCGNGTCESADGEDCSTCPDDCNGVQQGKPDNRYCCGAGGGTNPVPCSDGRCNGSGNICTDEPSYAYCCGDAQCSGAETSVTCGLDCTPPAPSEVSGSSFDRMWITGYDEQTGLISLSYGPACASDDSVIVYGELTRESMQSYSWSGEHCFIGTSGSYDWDATGAPASLFFVIVGQSSLSGLEGSYGTDGTGGERPPATANSVCPMIQELLNVCGG